MEKKDNQRLNKEIKKFGISFSIGMVILASFMFWKRGDHLVYIFIPLGLFLYHITFTFLFLPMVKPTFYILNFILKIVGNTLNVIIFAIVFYVFFSPIAIILRLTGKDHINLDSSSDSTWEEFTKNDPKGIEKLF